MKYRVLPYTLKVWLTSVALAPVLQMMVQLITQLPYKFNTLRDVVVYLLYMLVCGWLFSIPCWLLLLLSAWIANLITSKIRMVKITLTIAGVIIALLPFVTYAGQSLPQYNNPDFAWVMFYPLTIAAGVWMYKLTPTMQNGLVYEQHVDDHIGNTDEPIITWNLVWRYEVLETKVLETRSIVSLRWLQKSLWKSKGSIYKKDILILVSWFLPLIQKLFVAQNNRILTSAHNNYFGIGR